MSDLDCDELNQEVEINISIGEIACVNLSTIVKVGRLTTDNYASRIKINTAIHNLIQTVPIEYLKRLEDEYDKKTKEPVVTQDGEFVHISMRECSKLEKKLKAKHGSRK
jgi:glutamyl-tRNA reductase